MKKFAIIVLMTGVSMSAFASPKDAGKRVMHGVKVGVEAPFKGVHKLFSHPKAKPSAKPAAPFSLK